MNGTLYSLGLLDSGLGFALAGLLGVLFGFFLEQAGFGSSRKLTGIFYFRDMAVLKVMFTAVVVALLGLRYLTAFGVIDAGNLLLLDTYWGAQIVGGLLFGVGFVVGGWCPGTALVGIAGAKLDALVFVVGVILGSMVFNEVFPLVQPLYEGAHVPALFLPATLHLPASFVVLGFCVAAVAAFAVSTVIERRIGGQPRQAPEVTRRNAAAGLLLVGMGGLSLWLPEPPATAPATAATVPGTPAAAALPAGAQVLAEVSAGQDHVEPEELAEWLLAGTPGLVLVDVRPAAAYALFHLPGAINLPLDRFAVEAPLRLPTAGRVVLYSNGTTHAAQAWMELRRRGWTHAQVLTDGLLGFWRDCLTPPSLSGVPVAGGAAQEALSQAFRRRQAFFLGPPAGNAAADPGPVGP